MSMHTELLTAQKLAQERPQACCTSKAANLPVSTRTAAASHAPDAPVNLRQALLGKQLVRL